MASVRYRLQEFVSAPPDEILGRLADLYARMGFSALWTRAIEAWNAQFPVLQQAVVQLVTKRPAAREWHILLEYTIPLRDRRPDVIILATDIIFVIEFKVGALTHDSAARWQVQSYALDLRDFHPGCEGKTIVPILVATKAEGIEVSEKSPQRQFRATAFPVQQCNAANLSVCISSFDSVDGQPINGDRWDRAAYSPIPSIIEAAQKLFSGHQVQDISHCFSDTLETTSTAIVKAIAESRERKIRTICFVTGIPGSGKTLVGLNAVHSPALLEDRKSSAIFLSGNGPLVKVIRESLSREQARMGAKKEDAMELARAFIANVHGFIKTFGLDKRSEAPAQHAIVFDEAQRAWSAEAVEKEHETNRSEPALILDIMERVPEWAAVIALVGGGQEIHTGEAGLQEWGRALAERPERWRVLVSPEVISGGQSVAGHKLFPDGEPEGLQKVLKPELHLNVNVRSHRAEFIGAWVNRLLSDTAMEQFTLDTSGEFPVVLTRDLGRARQWLQERAESHQRVGLLASSGAIRLRSHGIELSSAFRRGVNYADWFLNGMHDVRSSFKLEIAATEFDCQGLELDWTCVCWGGDLVFDVESEKWKFSKFSGTNWRSVKDQVSRQYVVNKYRVLLTRARRGMIFWIPEGPEAAENVQHLNSTSGRLMKAGVQQLA